MTVPTAILRQALGTTRSSLAGIAELSMCALLQTVSTIFSAMDVHGWLTFNEFVQIVEVGVDPPMRCKSF